MMTISILFNFALGKAETKSIQFWIKDEVGALASTLAVFQVSMVLVT